MFGISLFQPNISNNITSHTHRWNKTKAYGQWKLNSRYLNSEVWLCGRKLRNHINRMSTYNNIKRHKILNLNLRKCRSGYIQATQKCPLILLSPYSFLSEPFEDCHPSRRNRVNFRNKTVSPTQKFLPKSAS